MKTSRTMGSAFAALLIVGTAVSGIATPAIASSHSTATHQAARTADQGHVIYPSNSDVSVPLTTLAKIAPKGISEVTRNDNGNISTGDNDPESGDGGANAPTRLRGGTFRVPVPKTGYRRNSRIQRNLLKRARHNLDATIQKGIDFAGMNFGNSGCSCAPPDTNADVGKSQIVETANSSLAVYAKDGSTILAPVLIKSLWFRFGGPCETRNDGDPIVLYDAAADRWLISQFTATSPYSECIAISKTGNAAGSYYRYAYAESGTTFGDYPHLGIWPAANNNTIGMTTNAFLNGANYGGSQPFLFNRAKLESGDPTAEMVSFPPQTVDSNPMLPANADGTSIGTPGPNAGFPFLMYADPASPAPYNSLTEYLANFNASNPAASTFGGSLPTDPAPASPSFTIPISAFSNTFNNCGATFRECVPTPGSPSRVAATNATWASTGGGRATVTFSSTSTPPLTGGTVTVSGMTPSGYNVSNVTVVSATSTTVTYAKTANPGSFVSGGTVVRGCTQAPLTVCNVDVIADRLMNRLTYRNISGTESLLTNWTANAGSDQAAPDWVQITNPESAPAVAQNGTYAPDSSTYRWMGSNNMDRLGNQMLGFSYSSSSTFPSIGVAGRTPSDPMNTLPESATMYSGSNAPAGVPRWGDYSSMSLDPTDQCTFWYAQEYTNSGGNFDWATRIGSFRFSNCTNTPASLTVTAGTPSSRGSVDNVTVTVKDANGLQATGYTGTVTLTSSDGSAGLPGPYTFTAADAGSHTFPVVFRTQGTENVTASDNTGLSSADSNVVNVTARADHLAVSAPASVGSGIPFAVTVTAQDASNNPLTSYTGTVHFTSSDVSAVLPPDYTFTASDNGTHTFTNQCPLDASHSGCAGGVMLTSLGNQTVTATDTGSPGINGSATTNVFTANTWVNNGTGSDSNDCLSAGSPCKTINAAVAKTSASGTVTVAAGTYVQNVVIDHNLTLTGSASKASATKIDGNNADSTVLINNGVTATVNDVQIQNGNGTSRSGGGGVFNGSGTLTLNHDIITGNTAAGSGALGGGVLNNLSAGGKLFIYNTTITGNTVPSNFGGGVYAGGRDFLLVNSTVTGNTAAADGGIRFRGCGGECVSAPQSVYNSTISSNHVTAAGQIGGVDRSGANGDPVIFGNTIIANNTNSANGASDCAGSFQSNGGASQGGNVLGNIGGCGGYFTATGDLVGNPQLGSLADNGGPTTTQKLGAGSAAIGDGRTAVCGNSQVNSLDQRGYARGNPCDSGAVQSGSAPDSLTYTGDTTFTDGTSGTMSGTLTDAVSGNPVAGDTITFALAPAGANQTCTGTTNGSGVASCTIAVVTAAPGARTVRMSFAGDATYAPNQLDTSVTVNQGNQDTLTYTGDTTFTDSTAGHLSATLTDSSNGNPIVGQTLTIALAPSSTNQDCTGVTNSSGSFSCTIALVSAPPGTRTVRVSFAGGGGYPANQLDTSVTVNAGPADTLTYTGDTTFTNGTTGTVSAKLTDSSNGNPLSGKVLRLALAPSANNQDCTAVTDGTGTATCTIQNVNEPTGTRTVRVTFSGSGGYPANQLDTSVTVS